MFAAPSSVLTSASYLGLYGERPLPQLVEEVQRGKHGPKVLQVTEAELVCQRGGRESRQGPQARQGARRHRGVWDLTWHRVSLGLNHS